MANIKSMSDTVCSIYHMSCGTACSAGSELQHCNVIWHNMAAFQHQQASSDIINSNLWHAFSHTNLQAQQMTDKCCLWYLNHHHPWDPQMHLKACLAAETVINLWWHAAFHYTAFCMIYTINSYEEFTVTRIQFFECQRGGRTCVFLVTVWHNNGVWRRKFSYKAATLLCNWIFFSTHRCCVTLSLKTRKFCHLFDTQKTESM